MIQTLEWTDKGVRFIDQTKLPTEETYVTATTYQQVADVIRTMVVRGRRPLASRRPWTSHWVYRTPKPRPSAI
jgi:methylthioribose-1-phosphate isomerase